MKNTLLLLLVGICFFSCSSDENPGDTTPEETNFNRAGMLVNWADNIIIPGYSDLSNSLNQLEEASNAFIQDQNNTTLQELRGAWEESYVVWQRVSMFEIGPAETVSLRLNINIYPTNTTQIISNIENGDYNLNLSSNRTAKGFPALDYLLFGIADTDATIIAKYTGAEGENERNYLRDIITDMKTLVQEVTLQWESQYRDTFVDNSGSSATASVDRLVNDYIFYFEKHLRAGKMGIPAGVFSSGGVLPENVEAFYNGTLSKSLFMEGLRATQDFYNGKHYDSNTQGESLRSYITTLNAVKNGEDLNAIINNQFSTAASSVSSLGSFSEELNNNPPTPFLNAYDEVQRLVPLLKVDMVSALSIAIDFVDADGD